MAAGASATSPVDRIIDDLDAAMKRLGLAMRDIPIRRGSFKRTHDNLAPRRRQGRHRTRRRPPHLPQEVAPALSALPATAHFGGAFLGPVGPHIHDSPRMAVRPDLSPKPTPTYDNTTIREATMATRDRGRSTGAVRHPSVRGSTRQTGAELR